MLIDYHRLKFHNIYGIIVFPSNTIVKIHAKPVVSKAGAVFSTTSPQRLQVFLVERFMGLLCQEKLFSKVRIMQKDCVTGRHALLVIQQTLSLV